MSSVDVAIAHRSRLGECPLWSPTEAVLYWVDIDAQEIHRFDPDTGVDDRRVVAGRPGSLALTRTPGVLLAAVEHELVWFRWSDGASAPFVALEDPGTGNRLNDGKTDPAGRFIVGSMWADPSDGRRTGLLHTVEGDGAHRVLRHDIGVTNGLGFDRVRERAYFADTFTETVVRWNYDLSTGSCDDEQIFVDYAPLRGLPDGACVDADGCYWSASVFGWAVLRITPDGRIDRRIDLPLEKPSMPAFGGPDLSTLFITTIGDGGGRPSKPGDGGVIPGSVLAVEPGVSGVAEVPFAGSPPW